MFEHKGVKIEVTPSGEFRAFVNGEHITATSLPAIKKKLEKVEAFEAFDALTKETYRATFSAIRIVGIAKARGKRSWSNADRWLDDKGNTYSVVWKNTPETCTAMTRLCEVQAANKNETAAMEVRHSESERAARDFLPDTIKPE